FASASSTHLSGSKLELLEIIRLRIEPFMSQAGVLVAQPGASSTIVVTDTPEALDRIGAYLERENRAMTRRVRIVFEEITVALDETDEEGVDWSLLFSSARLTDAARAMTGSEEADASARLSAQATQGPYAGTRLLLSALSESGQVVRRASVPV